MSAILKHTEYPTADGLPMAETDFHRDLMVALIKILQRWFGTEPLVYVSGNLLLYYVQGDRRKHVAPDVFVVMGVPNHRREKYLLWEEGKSPRAVIEITSASTRHEDTGTKFRLYRDVLKVREYFLFDPRGDYLTPPLQGYRLTEGDYRPIRVRGGRLSSKELGLHLVQSGSDLWLINPATGQRLLPPEEELREREKDIERLQKRIDELSRGANF